MCDRAASCVYDCTEWKFDKNNNNKNNNNNNNNTIVMVMLNDESYGIEDMSLTVKISIDIFMAWMKIRIGIIHH